MRAISKSVRQAIDELHAVPASPRREALLHAIAASGEWQAIPHLVSLALGSRDELAAGAVLRLFDGLPLHGVSSLDQAMRRSTLGAPWYQLRPADLDRIASLAGGPALLQLAMCHPSGHVRQEAIGLAGAHPDGGRELRFFLLRLNDWVIVVRAAAARAIRARLTPERVDDLWAAVPLVDLAASWGRIDQRAVLDEIESLLASPQAGEAHRRALRHQDRIIRRAAFRRAPAAGFPPREVLSAALADPDPAIRLSAARSLDAGSDEIRLMVRDPAGPIRHRALRLALERGVEVPLEPLLTDGHAELRSLAQAALLARDVDVVALYHSLVADSRGRRRAAAAIGLAEAAGADAIDHLSSFLTDGTPAVRAAALRARDLAGADDSPQHCLAALADRSPRVTHAARDLLRKRRTVRDPARLWRALEAAPAAAGKLDALAVLGQLDFWRRLPHLLDATRLGPALHTHALHELRRWIALWPRRFTSPSPDTAAAIRGALARAAIDEPLRREIARLVAERER